MIKRSWLQPAVFCQSILSVTNRLENISLRSLLLFFAFHLLYLPRMVKEEQADTNTSVLQSSEQVQYVLAPNLTVEIISLMPIS